MSKPVANPKSGSLCQFCVEERFCLLASGLGENDCPIFIPDREPRNFELNVRCEIEEAKKIHMDVAYLTKRCDFELARALMVGSGKYVSYFTEMKNILYQHLRRLNQILPNVANRKTPFTLVSRVRKEDDWKEDYKALMKKLHEHVPPEEASENLRSMAEFEDLMRKAELEKDKEEKPCSSELQSSSSPLPLFGEHTKGGK